MASRRDELNAYTFARKRMVGAFLQPSGGGNDEDAPRPVRAVLPSVVVAAVIVAGFGMWGVIKPSAPVGWDDGKSIIQGKDSTTRYVVLPDAGTKEMKLHQVLNMSSARLVTPAGAKVLVVADSVLDSYKSHGSTIGIPYAPDKLPLPDEAGVAKKWSVCDRASKDNTQATINQALFVAAGKEAKTLAMPDLLLSSGQWLFVQGPEEANNRGSEYLVDSSGMKHPVGDAGTSAEDRRSLESALFKNDAQPQQVTKEWLNTLQNGKRIVFPQVPDFRRDSPVKSNVNISQTAERFVGRLLSYQNKSFYVVGRDKLYQVSPFQAELIRQDPALKVIYNGFPTYTELSPGDFASLGNSIDKTTLWHPDDDLPKGAPADHPVNFNGDGKGRIVLCSTFESMDGGTVKQSVWADTKYPSPVTTGSASAHVSAGAGLLFRSVDAAAGGSGSTFLITETGLRYSVQNNGDGAKAAATPNPQPAANAQTDNAQARLGYDKIQPVLVPSLWAGLVPGGPVLGTGAALQEQNA